MILIQRDTLINIMNLIASTDLITYVSITIRYPTSILRNSNGISFKAILSDSNDIFA